jgi:hypothetical protein
MVLRPLLALPIPLTIALAMLGCGDAKKAPVASASEAPVDPSKSDPKCTNATAAVVADRCAKGGEMSCCSRLIEGKVPEDPKELEDFGVACKGGHIKACDIVREATREFANVATPSPALTELRKRADTLLAEQPETPPQPDEPSSFSGWECRPNGPSATEGREQ